MAETELKVILEAKDLAEHTLRVTSNCNRLLATVNSTKKTPRTKKIGKIQNL